MKAKTLTTLLCSGLSLAWVGNAHCGSPQQQRLIVISSQDGQMVRLACATSPAQAFLVQTSTSLEPPAWSTLTTAIPDANGFFTWTYSGSKSERCRFFRLAQIAPFTGGLMAKNEILFSGGAFLDSFDSGDTNLSSNGLYDPAKRRDRALAQTASQAAGAITIQSGFIFGEAAAGPGATIVCSKGAVGELAWNATHFGIEPGRANDDTHLVFQDIAAPFTSGSSVPVSGRFNGQNYTYLLGSGNYELPAVEISGGKSMVVTGSAVLYVPGNFTTSGSGFVLVAPGATLQLYVGGSLTVSGAGIINGNGRAADCWIFGLPTCKTITLSGSSTFCGVVDAPEANLTLSGSAGACGSFMADSITLSGSAGVHYDESLAGPAFP